MPIVTKTKRLPGQEPPVAAESQKVGSGDAPPPPATKRRVRRWLPYWVLALTYRFRRLDYPFLKRLIDVAGSALLLVLLLPLFAVVAAVVKVSDGGPVLFWQTRVGRWGRPFCMPKFRSMVPDAEQLLPAPAAAKRPQGSGGVQDEGRPAPDLDRRSPPQIQHRRVASIVVRAERGHVARRPAPVAAPGGRSIQRCATAAAWTCCPA